MPRTVASDLRLHFLLSLYVQVLRINTVQNVVDVITLNVQGEKILYFQGGIFFQKRAKQL